jgi:hypothetical protein
LPFCPSHTAKREDLRVNGVFDVELDRLEKDIIQLKEQTAENIIQIGYKLIDAKERLSHGEWGIWLENKVEFSQRTANQFMRIAKEFGSNSQAISNLEITKVGMLLDIPSEKREEFIENHDLKAMSTRNIKKAVREFIGDGLFNSVIDYERDYGEYEIPIDELKPLPHHEIFFPIRTGEDWIYFLNSVNEYGVKENVMISRDKTIIAGHERVRALKDLGIETVKCTYVSLEEEFRKGYTDDKLKLYLFITLNMHLRSTDWYLAQFWLDTLFDTNYGDKSGDINDYLTDERVEALSHNMNILAKMYDVLLKEKEGTVNKEESDNIIHKLHEQYVDVP